MSDTGGGREGGGPENPRSEGSAGGAGSVGEEAAKLFGALSGWARDQSSDAGSAGGAAGALADAVKDMGEHLATDGEDCRYCPICQVIHVVRHTSPEVRSHLAAAGGSLMRAVAEMLATVPPRDQHPSPAVEKIDLDSDSDWDEDR